jgi:hypothetical protein
MHEEHKRLRLGERRSVTLLLALRPWELQDFMDLRRERRAAPVVNVMTSEGASVADEAESAPAMIMAAPGGQETS